MSEKKTLLGGCALVTGLVVAIVVLALLLWRELSSDAGAESPGEPAREERSESYLSRPERRELESRLERVEQDLQFARGQVYAESTSAGTRAAWRERVTELERARAELRAKLGR